MRITLGQLRQIIKEEIGRSLVSESPMSSMQRPMHKKLRAGAPVPLTSVSIEDFPAELMRRQSSPLYMSVVESTANHALQELDDGAYEPEDFRKVFRYIPEPYLLGGYWYELTWRALGTSDDEFLRLASGRKNDPREKLLEDAMEKFLDDVEAKIQELAYS